MARKKNTETGENPKKETKKKSKQTKEESLETILFNCRNNLRGRAAMTDKRDLLLTLVFFKFIGDRFSERQDEIRTEYKAKGLPEENIEKLLLNKNLYKQNGGFMLSDETNWNVLKLKDAKEMAIAFDNAITILDNTEDKLKNALPAQIFTKTQLEANVLKSIVDEIEKIDPKRFQDRDLIGRVYEYFLQAFSINADKEEGEFYTPHSIVELIAALIEPYDGTVYDPCCGSGGMFIQAARFVEAHGKNSSTVDVYGQESEPATFRLAKMNLAIRGISYHLGEKAVSTFSNDQHKDLHVDYIMANPPFNLGKYADYGGFDTDPRWKGYGVPPTSNANYAWILHMLNKLKADTGIAGFLLANGELDDDKTLGIRSQLIDNDKVEAIIVLPRNMFYSTDISVTLWILNNNKKGGMWHDRNLRNRTNEVLFVDLRTWSENIYEKKFVQLSHEQIQRVCNIYHTWQAEGTSGFSIKAGDKYMSHYAYPELYYSAHIDEIREKNYSLIPSRYIEFIDRDTEMDYSQALNDMSTKFDELKARWDENEKSLMNAFKMLGYGE